MEVDSKAQATRQVASAMSDLDNVSQVKNHNGSIGVIDFVVHRDKALSQNRIMGLLPEGWDCHLVVNSGMVTNLYLTEK